jgi:hypothetical protein
MANMDWDDYLRDEAAIYRQLAEKTENVFGKQDLLELAAICEEVANGDVTTHRCLWKDPAVSARSSSWSARLLSVVMMLAPARSAVPVPRRLSRLHLCNDWLSPFLAMNPLVTGLSPFVGEGGSWVHCQRA